MTMTPPIQLSRTKGQPSKSNLQNHVFTPRLILASFSLPFLYLLTPHMVICILRTISSLSSNHEFLSILLCIALTNTVRHQIYIHAPTEKERDIALEKCFWKLPLLSLIVSMFICNMISGARNDDVSSWWDGNKWWGIRFFVVGISLSCITMARFIGPFKIVKCSNSISYKNPREISAIQSIWQSIDYFLYYMTLPSSSQKKFQHATFKEVTQHVIVVGILLGCIVGNLYSLLVFDETVGYLCIFSSVATTVYLFLHVVNTKRFDVDVSYFPNMQQDTKWYIWVLEQGISNILVVLRQMIPFFIVMVVSGMLGGFFMSFIQVLFFVIVPMICHVVFTDLFTRLFLSQHVNLSYFSPQTILELLLMDANDISHIIVKSNNPIYSPMEEENNIYFQSVSTMSNTLSVGTHPLKSPDVLDNILRFVFLKSLQNQSNQPPVSDANKEGSIELVHILRYLCVYLGSLGAALGQLHEESFLKNDNMSNQRQVFVPCLSTCTLAHINYSITILHSVLRDEPRHPRMSILVPIFFQSLFDLHKGLLEHTRHVDERKNIVTLNTIEDVVMDFINEVHDTLKMQPEVKLWVDDIRDRYEKKNI